ncbi:MAG TPA: hypothetical protein VGI71_17625 [Scandinavium sp.]
MNIYVIMSVTLSLKLLFTFFVYKKNKQSFKRLSLPAKGAVIGGGWLAGYGLLQIVEGFI